MDGAVIAVTISLTGLMYVYRAMDGPQVSQQRVPAGPVQSSADQRIPRAPETDVTRSQASGKQRTEPILGPKDSRQTPLQRDGCGHAHRKPFKQYPPAEGVAAMEDRFTLGRRPS